MRLGATGKQARTEEIQMSAGKNKKPEFGKRGREMLEPTERKATAVQRLQDMGSRWWLASGLPTIRKAAPVKGFKRAPLRP